MRNLKQFTMAAMAVAAMVAASGGGLSAGEPGIVRISDSARPGTSYQSRTIQTSARTISHSNTTSNFDGQYSSGGCSSCGNGCGECDGCKRRKPCCQFGCKAPCHGWGRPLKRPINRLPVQYQRYWPNGWYGERGAGYTGAGVNYYPMVYTPTDTTQLGFYYQQVPFWRPVPDMVPPVPWPSQWHLREGQNPYGATTNGTACGANAAGNGNDSNQEPVPEPDDAPADPGAEPPPVPRNPSETALNSIP